MCWHVLANQASIVGLHFNTSYDVPGYAMNKIYCVDNRAYLL